MFIRIYGLTPGTVYHYRVVAASEGGTGDAGGRDVHDAAAAEPARTAQAAAGQIRRERVASFFAAQLKPTGKGAKIGALLKAGLYRQRFKAPAGGHRFDQVVLPAARERSCRSAARRQPPPVLVASGSVKFKTAGSATLTLRLTSAGRRLLGHSKSLRLTAKLHVQAGERHCGDHDRHLPAQALSGLSGPVRVAYREVSRRSKGSIRVM